MNMYTTVREQEGKPFPFYPYELDGGESADQEYIIQTHPTDPHIGLVYRKLETAYDYLCAYRYTVECDWVVADEQEVIAEAIRDARRWLALEKGGWKR